MVDSTRGCDVEGCERAHRARGLCGSHYNQTHVKVRHKTFVIICCECGAEHRTVRTNARFCSLTCRDARYARERERRAKLPALWVRPKRAVVQQPGQPPLFRYRALVSGVCLVCGSWFVDRWADARYCSTKCRDREHDRREREGRVSNAVRRLVYERDGWICQLCFEQVDPSLHYLDPMAPTVDHVICRSWTLVPDNRSTNLRLAHRVCNTERGNAA